MRYFKLIRQTWSVSEQTVRMQTQKDRSLNILLLSAMHRALGTRAQNRAVYLF